MKKWAAIVLIISIVFLCADFAYGYGNPKYMVRYFKGVNGWPSYYFDVRNKNAYLRVKVKGKYVYAALYNAKGNHIKYNGVLYKKK